MAEPETKSDLSLQLYEARDTTGDVTIKAKTRSFKVHLCVISARSPVFANMLSSDMQEGRGKVINLEHFDDAIVNHLIHFMYLDWTKGPKGDLMQLLKLAHMYEFKDLLAKCWRSVMKTSSPETIVDLLLLAEKYGDQEEKHKASVYLLENLHAVIKTKNYSTLIKEHADLYLRICGTPISDPVQEGEPSGKKKKIKTEFVLGNDPTGSRLRIFAKSMDQSWSLHVKPSDSIQNLKAMIYGVSGISPSKQRLVLNGSELNDNYDLCDYEIEDYSNIHVLRH